MKWATLKRQSLRWRLPEEPEGKKELVPIALVSSGSSVATVSLEDSDKRVESQPAQDCQGAGLGHESARPHVWNLSYSGLKD